MSATFVLLVFSFFGVGLSAYPYYVFHAVDDLPAAYPVQRLVYPPVVYRSRNVSNDAYQMKGPDFVIGHKTPRDQLLLHTTVYKRPGIWSSYASKEITFPPPGNVMKVNITQVNAHDRGVNGTGGFVKLVRGGIGKENVTLAFRSQKNRPINFELDIYGVSRR